MDNAREWWGKQSVQTQRILQLGLGTLGITIFCLGAKSAHLMWKKRRDARYSPSDTDNSPITKLPPTTTTNSTANLTATSKIDHTASPAPRQLNGHKKPSTTTPSSSPLDESVVLALLQQNSDHNAEQLDSDSEFAEHESAPSLSAAHLANDKLTQQIFGLLTGIAGREGECSFEMRIEAAKWLLNYHARCNALAQNPAEAVILERNTMPTLHCAIRFLQPEKTPIQSESESRAADLLLLDALIKLKAYLKVIPIFDRAVLRDRAPEGLSFEEQLVAFTVAPYIGRWSAVRDFGDRILQVRDSLDDFHAASESNNNIPDYSCLLELAEHVPDVPTAEIRSALQYRRWQMDSFAIRLVRVECVDVGRAEAVSALFDSKNGARKWQEYPVLAEDIVQQLGGFATLQSKSTQPCHMFGPLYCDSHGRQHLRALGYRHMILASSMSNSQTLQIAGGNAFDTVLKQSEEFSLLRDAHNIALWSGEYKLTQETFLEVYDEHDDSSTKHAHPTIPPVVVVFNLKVSLSEAN